MLNKKGKIFIGIIIICASIISLYLISNISKVLKEEKIENPDTSLKPTLISKIDYNVCLYENPFIEEECFNKNLSYISSLVKYIDVDFLYQFNAKENKKISYEYKIIAKIVSNHVTEAGKGVNNPIWEKNFIIKDTTTVNNEEGLIDIKENIKINLDYYNQIVESFKSELNLAVNSTLYVNLIINPKIYNIPANQQQLSINFPLNVKSFDIFTHKNVDDKDLLTDSKGIVNMENKYFVIIINIISLLIVIGTCLIVILFINKLVKNKYNLDIEKIMKNYANRIIVVTNFVDYTKAEIIDIIDFDEMLNLADETCEPIMSWEKVPNQETWFAIFRNNILYRFIMKKED